MARKNNKTQLVSYENSIKKSNDFSMAHLNHGLTLNQMQLFAYAIYCTQQDGSTEFIKAEFERKFNLTKYKTEFAFRDSEKISALRYSTQNLEEKKFSFSAIFTNLEYDNGTFRVVWNPMFLPHILELKDYYVTTDLTITSKFKSGFSWSLYEYLKARYGAYYVPVSKEALLRLFGVENRKTYINSTAQFKRGVLDVAVNEINECTELEVWYKEKKQGQTIVGFELHWSTGETVQLATEKQSVAIKRLVDEIFALWDDVMKMDEGVNKDKAIGLFRDTEDMRRGREESLTSKEVNDYIPKAKDNLKWIEAYLDNDKEPRTVTPVPFYNWLEERE